MTSAKLLSKPGTCRLTDSFIFPLGPSTDNVHNRQARQNLKILERLREDGRQNLEILERLQRLEDGGQLLELSGLSAQGPR